MMLPGVTGGEKYFFCSSFSILFSAILSPKNKSRNDLQSINRNYKVEQGNHIFKLSIDDNDKSYFIIAKEIDVNIINP